MDFESLNLIPRFGDFKPGEKDFVEAEKYLGSRLPDDYKRFLSVCNGGHLSPDLDDSFLYFEPPGNEETYYFAQSFYGLAPQSAAFVESVGHPEVGDEYSSDILSCYYRHWEFEVQRFLLPIASDGLGNNLCLSLRPQDHGKIYFWDNADWPCEFDDRGHPIAIVGFEPAFASFTDMFNCRVDLPASLLAEKQRLNSPIEYELKPLPPQQFRLSWPWP